MSNEDKYVGLDEAARLTERSYSTMRNLIRSMTLDEKDKYLLKDGKRILILKEYLASKYRIVQQVHEPQSDFERRTLEVLERELKAKNEQIAAQQKTISEMVERLKEANWNQASLHKFLNGLGLDDSQIQKMIK